MSADRSDYEGATLLHDLNRSFPEKLRGTFDLVIDGGTLEHIFDFPAALRHCLELVSVGGHFITITPANQWMGHGFYQFSPELYFRAFQKENGFTLRKIILFDCAQTDAPFYQVHDPATAGTRVQLSSRKLISMAVLGQKTAAVPIFSTPPQQSDYVAVWDQHQKSEKTKQSPEGLVQQLRVKLNPYWPYWLRTWKTKLSHFRREGGHSLNNTRQFCRLTREEITCERTGNPPA
ncbi:MAG TPA: class I SAM-dependent methyltransferase [Verrucomicrobiae bacterium]|nr:class I SAM-dependent methyltransferase [Verrucomicrobiae bacterium]